MSKAKKIRTVPYSFARSLSIWSSVPLAPPDKILGLTLAYKEDASPQKINLGVGAYRDNDGNPYVLNAVRKAEQRVVAHGLDKE